MQGSRPGAASGIGPAGGRRLAPWAAGGRAGSAPSAASSSRFQAFRRSASEPALAGGPVDRVDRGVGGVLVSLQLGGIPAAAVVTPQRLGDGEEPVMAPADARRGARRLDRRNSCPASLSHTSLAQICGSTAAIRSISRGRVGHVLAERGELPGVTGNRVAVASGHHSRGLLTG